MHRCYSQHATETRGSGAFTGIYQRTPPGTPAISASARQEVTRIKPTRERAGADGEAYQRSRQGVDVLDEALQVVPGLEGCQLQLERQSIHLPGQSRARTASIDAPHSTPLHPESRHNTTLGQSPSAHGAGRGNEPSHPSPRKPPRSVWMRNTLRHSRHARGYETRHRHGQHLRQLETEYTLFSTKSGRIRSALACLKTACVWAHTPWQQGWGASSTTRSHVTRTKKRYGNRQQRVSLFLLQERAPEASRTGINRFTKAVHWPSSSVLQPDTLTR